MAPETHSPPPQPPITTAPEIIPQTTAQPKSIISALPAIPPKRQRRPSVRLGEIDDQRDILRRCNQPPLNWKGRTVAKRGSTKRLRSDYAPKPKRFNNFNHDHDHDHDHSVDENGNDYCVNRNNENRVRVLINEGFESESKEQRKNEGVWTWLFDLGLSRYAPIFEFHEVDDDLLPLLTLEDLKDMGISAVGSRRKMFNAIQKLRKVVPVP